MEQTNNLPKKFEVKVKILLLGVCCIVISITTICIVFTRTSGLNDRSTEEIKLENVEYDRFKPTVKKGLSLKNDNFIAPNQALKNVRFQV